MRRPAFRALGRLVLIAYLLCGCGSGVLTRRVATPSDTKALQRASKFLKSHMRDGRVYVLADWTIDEKNGVVTGDGTLFDANRAPVSSGFQTIAIDSVVLFETNVSRPPLALGFMTIVTGASLVLSVFCLSHPKSCFGSCPTFYVWDGERDALAAEGFSSSVSPALEATDVDALFRARPKGRALEVTMRNEALETHVVRHADLLALPRIPGGRTLVTPGGAFWRAKRLVPPLRCAGPEGDVTAAVRTMDGIERASLADSFDLATREEIEIAFEAPGDGPLGLVIGSRQSLLSTYLFYQTLANMGTRAGEWMAKVERGGPALRGPARAIGNELGGIEVFVRDGAGAWEPAGTTSETGPLATDVRMLPLPARKGGPLAVKLRLTRGMWRLDLLALAVLDAPADPIRLHPSRVLCDGEPDEAARAALLDSTRVLTTYPGDAYTLCYDLPDDPERLELFLESRGYYFEWIRQEWLAEEDPARAAEIFLDPRGALRRLAPEFKKVEPTMEDAFWRSRFAGR